MSSTHPGGERGGGVASKGLITHPGGEGLIRGYNEGFIAIRSQASPAPHQHNAFVAINGEIRRHVVHQSHVHLFIHLDLDSGAEVMRGDVGWWW